MCVRMRSTLKRQEYKVRVLKTLNFEAQILEEFEQLCKEERTYLSHKLQDMMVDELQKKDVGAENPLNISYSTKSNKAYQSNKWHQTTLPIFTRSEVMDRIRDIEDPEHIDLIEHTGLMMVAASRWKRTGVIRDVRVV